MEKSKLNEELQIAFKKLLDNPNDGKIMGEINSIRIKLINSSKIVNSEVATTNSQSLNDAQQSSANLESSNNEHLPEHDSQASSTNLESSNNEHLPQHDSQALSANPESSNNEHLSQHDSQQLIHNDQNNYLQIVRDRGFQWMDGLFLGLIVCVVGAFIFKQILGRATAFLCVILLLLLVGLFIVDILSKNACKKRRA
ncbi:unnamed protein product [Rotaria sordida]|uniref:Uncharacterized protein n=1 Tax=Rotaria sordida TaxID=392033 RepID=A0A814BK74_9BILA|nr:unnamed protein product [Rotaria sordida]CAF4083594.1 unnamed protein product [Rotaria sordida]